MRSKISDMAHSEIDLANLGANEVAYVRRMTSDEILNRYPQSPELPRGVVLWALFAADGSPLAVSDEAQSVLSTALERDLVTVSLH